MADGAGRRLTVGIGLRYGAFYGPGTSLGPGEEQFELFPKRKFPVIGDGRSVVLHPHCRRGEATVAAVEHGSRGVYNVVDDDPALVGIWARPAAGKARDRAHRSSLP